MLNNLSKYSIVLASKSPRRMELLKGLGIPFEVKVLKDVDETYPDNLIGEEIPIFIANKKADSWSKIISDNNLIITADTIVYLRNSQNYGTVLGKPKDYEMAKKMLKTLSGNKHEVITGVCILTKHKRTSFAVNTQVSFDILSEEDIDFYIHNFKPMDKAGAYGIQEWIGYIGVNGLVGSYFNVMGLPVQRLYKELQKF